MKKRGGGEGGGGETKVKPSRVPLRGRSLKEKGRGGWSTKVKP